MTKQETVLCFLLQHTQMDFKDLYSKLHPSTGFSKNTLLKILSLLIANGLIKRNKHLRFVFTDAGYQKAKALDANSKPIDKSAQPPTRKKNRSLNKGQLQALLDLADDMQLELNGYLEDYTDKGPGYQQTQNLIYRYQNLRRSIAQKTAHQMGN